MRGGGQYWSDQALRALRCVSFDEMWPLRQLAMFSYWMEETRNTWLLFLSRAILYETVARLSVQDGEVERKRRR